MITLTFLRAWFRWALGIAAVLFTDWIVVRDWVWRAAITGFATLVFLVVTAGLVGRLENAPATAAPATTTPSTTTAI